MKLKPIRFNMLRGERSPFGFMDNEFTETQPSSQKADAPTQEGDEFCLVDILTVFSMVQFSHYIE